MEVDQDKMYRALVGVKAVSGLVFVFYLFKLSSVLVENGCRYMAVIS